MPAIDVHTHAFPDGLAERAIAALEAECPWKAVARGTIAELLKSMDEADIDVSLVCAIATKPDQAEGILKWCRKIRSDRIAPLPSVHPKTPDAPAWLGRFAEEGFAGIKLHPMYQAFAVDEGALDGIYAAAGERGLLVVLHCGRDIAFPPDDDRASPARLRRVVQRHPRLRLLCTHMGGWRMWDQVERELLGTEVYMETSFALEDLGPRQAADMIRRHGTQRVLFGSDWPWAAQRHQVDLLRKLPLTDQERDALLWSNAARMLGF